MDEMTQEIYSEVYSILNLLGDYFINKLPTSLYEMIKKEKSSTYNPQYSKKIDLNEQNIKRESLSMIALFHLNYWCNDESKKEELRKIFLDNENKYQVELREKYNPDNIFNKKEVLKIKQEENYNKNLPVEVKEEKFYRKLIDFIKKIFKFVK